MGELALMWGGSVAALLAVAGWAYGVGYRAARRDQARAAELARAKGLRANDADEGDA